MPIPDYQSLMSPVLSLMVDKQTRSAKEVVAAISVYLHWTDKDMEELLPSGSQTVAHSRINWAITYLKKAGLLESPRRSQVCITEEGSRVTALKDVKVDNRFLRSYPEFVAFYNRSDSKGNNDKQTIPIEPNLSELSPEEQLDSAALSLQQSVA